MWNFITFWGDSSFTLPAALLMFLWLCYNTQWRIALHWAFCFCIAMSIVATSKVLFMGWHIAPPALNFTGISGHSASAMVLLVPAALLLAPWHGKLRFACIATAIAMGLAVGYSRLSLGVHSPSEIASGLVIGLLGAALFGYRLAKLPPKRPLKARLPLALLMLTLPWAIDFRPAPTQDLLAQIAQTLSGRGQVFTRSTPL